MEVISHTDKVIYQHVTVLLETGMNVLFQLRILNLLIKYFYDECLHCLNQNCP